MTAVRILPLDAWGEWPVAMRAVVHSAIEAALPAVLAALPLDRLDIVAWASDRVIPELGVTGYAMNRGLLTLQVDPANPAARAAAMPARIGAILAHEMHHVARDRGPRYGRSLGEALVSEGLAQAFEAELGYPVPFYATALLPPVLAAFADRARPLAGKVGYDHAAWFYGRSDDPAFPRHGGYSLGYAIVRAWLNRSGTTAAAAATTPAADILADFLAGKAGAIHAR